MTAVSVLVPANFDCAHRRAAWRHVEQHYRTNHPDWQLVVGDHGGGAWCKGRAVAAAAARADGDVLVIADADVYTAPAALEQAVSVAATGEQWAIPHKLVHRLTEAETARVLAGHEPRRAAVTIAPYEGAAGGGLVAIPRAMWDEVGGIDTGFVGWGREDHSLGWALSAMFGWHVRGTGLLWHLWHPGGEGGRQPTDANRDLGQRYRKARQAPLVMAALIAERRASGHLAPAHLHRDRDPRGAHVDA